MSAMIDIIVTRHTDLAAYLVEIGIAAPDTLVVARATGCRGRGLRRPKDPVAPCAPPNCASSKN